MNYIQNLNLTQMRKMLNHFNRIVKIKGVRKMTKVELQNEISRLFTIRRVPSDDALFDYFLEVSLKPIYDLKNIDNILTESNKKYQRKIKDIDLVLDQLRYVNDPSAYLAIPNKLQFMRELINHRQSILDSNYDRTSQEYNDLLNWMPPPHLKMVLTRLKNE